MIGFRDQVPLLQIENGQVTTMRQEWLVRSLERAASQAGYQNWWLADHVMESVMCYLRLEFEESVMSLPRLRTSIQSVLQAIGYSDVAGNFQLPTPPLEISLPELARTAGTGYELVFFHLLRDRLKQLVDARTEQIHLNGLRGCVYYLRDVKSWRRSCSRLRAEIVDYSRTVLACQPDARNVVLTLS